MKRRYNFDDEDERPHWLWRLTKGAMAGFLVSGVAAAILSIYVLPPPAPPPPEPMAEAEGAPKVIDGIEVSSEPAYFGSANAATDPAEQAAGPTEPTELTGPALIANAEPFAAPPGGPLVAVVLTDAAANPLLHESLFALDLPLTVGVVAGGPGDQVTARAAREAGFEVVAELPVAETGAAEGAMLESGLSAAEAAERTELLMRRLPVAVAAMRGTNAAAPLDAGLLQGVLLALGPLGFAYLDHGLAPGTRSSVASDGLEQIVAVSRYAIPAGATAAEAHAVLDRAAAEAEETGSAVVMAEAEPEVLLALQLWGGEVAGGMAQLAPLSAVVRRQNGGDMTAEELLGDAAAAEPAAAEAAADPAESPAN